MVQPCSKNSRRKISQNSTEVDAITKESPRKAEEELDGRNKEGHERNKPKRRPVGRSIPLCWEILILPHILPSNRQNFNNIITPMN
jgi:hypothetical protein